MAWVERTARIKDTAASNGASEATSVLCTGTPHAPVAANSRENLQARPNPQGVQSCACVLCGQSVTGWAL